MGIASFLCILCALWAICSAVVMRVLKTHDTEIVLMLRIKYRKAFEIEEWESIQTALVAGGPISLLLIFTAWGMRW